MWWAPDRGSTGPMKGTRPARKFQGHNLGTASRNHHHWKLLSPAAKRRAVDMLKKTLSMSERLACKAVGLARSTYRNLPIAQTRREYERPGLAAGHRAAGGHRRERIVLPAFPEGPERPQHDGLPGLLLGPRNVTGLHLDRQRLLTPKTMRYTASKDRTRPLAWSLTSDLPSASGAARSTQTFSEL